MKTIKTMLRRVFCRVILQSFQGVCPETVAASICSRDMLECFVAASAALPRSHARRPIFAYMREARQWTVIHRWPFAALLAAATSAALGRREASARQGARVAWSARRHSPETELRLVQLHLLRLVLAPLGVAE